VKTIKTLSIPKKETFNLIMEQKEKTSILQCSNTENVLYSSINNLIMSYPHLCGIGATSKC
jgi:hypothetical protein